MQAPAMTSKMNQKDSFRKDDDEASKIMILMKLCGCIICLQRWDISLQTDFPVTTPRSHEHHIASKRQAELDKMDQVNDSHLSFLGLKDSKGQLCLKVPCMCLLFQTNSRSSRHILSIC